MSIAISISRTCLLPSNAAHLLIPMMRVHDRLQPHTVHHSLRQIILTIWRLPAEDRFDIDFAAVEQAASQQTVGGQAEAVAGGAERGGHRTDESNAPARLG